MDLAGIAFPVALDQTFSDEELEKFARWQEEARRQGASDESLTVGRPSALLAAGLLATLLLPGPEASIYEGHYLTGLEPSAFHPCAERYKDEQWWVTADSAAWAALRAGNRTHRAAPWPNSPLLRPDSRRGE